MGALKTSGFCLNCNGHLLWCASAHCSAGLTPTWTPRNLKCCLQSGVSKFRKRDQATNRYHYSLACSVDNMEPKFRSHVIHTFRIQKLANSTFLDRDSGSGEGCNVTFSFATLVVIGGALCVQKVFPRNTTYFS